MDKAQAEAIADALLKEARSKRPPQKRRAGWGLRTLGERLLLFAFAIAGACAGLGVFHFTAREANSAALFAGAEWGAGAGLLLGWVVMGLRRVLATRKASATAHDD